MGNITVTYRDGRTAQLEQVYIRGSKIRFIILPDMLKNAPMFKNIKGSKATQGRGKTAIIKASAAASGGDRGNGRGGRGGRGAPTTDSRGGGRGGFSGGDRGGSAGRSRGTNVYQKR